MGSLGPLNDLQVANVMTARCCRPSVFRPKTKPDLSSLALLWLLFTSRQERATHSTRCEGAELWTTTAVNKGGPARTPERLYSCRHKDENCTPVREVYSRLWFYLVTSTDGLKKTGPCTGNYRRLMEQWREM